MLHNLHANQYGQGLEFIRLEGCGKKGIVGQRDSLEERTLREAYEDDADAGGSDVDTDDFHRGTPLPRIFFHGALKLFYNERRNNPSSKK